jgi:homoserine O-acetyltransferase/O-succinyltransferase
VLPLAELRYQTYGQLNADRSNVIVVCHALTGNASLHSWWGGLLTSALQHNESESSSASPYFVVCCNILGSCYGSTGPASINPETGKPYGRDFPDVSIRDTVRLQLKLLQEELKVASVLSVIGGSFGGMQALEFAAQAGCAASDIPQTSSSTSDVDSLVFDANGQPFVRTVIPIACGAQHTAWQIGISEVQRQAIYMDPAWDSDNPFGATSGLQVARQLGMLSYRTAAAYQTKFGRATASPTPTYGSNADWQVKLYLEYQGRKFLSRLDPVTYVKLTEQMDSHDVTRRRGASVTDVLSRVTIPALVLGIDSDVLYPISEQHALAAALPRSTFHTIHSMDGHDGFLLEQDQVASHISTFLAQHDKYS